VDAVGLARVHVVEQVFIGSVAIGVGQVICAGRVTQPETPARRGRRPRNFHDSDGFALKQPVRALAAAGTRVFMATASPIPGLPSPVITVLDTKDNSWTTIDAARGLPAAQITSLYADDRYLWIASPGLISRFDYTKELR
jgi:hypothetical protein